MVVESFLQKRFCLKRKEEMAMVSREQEFCVAKPTETIHHSPFTIHLGERKANR
jgi:hypothetical protein